VFTAESGDVVLLFSDGVQDQLAPFEEGKEPQDFGTRRLTRLLKKMRDKPASEIVGAIFNDLDRFAAGTPITDDQSIIVLKVT
jgi:serine phosphatase RsbU (regulator of sigma subunit)